MSEGRTLYIAILSQNQKYLRIEIYTCMGYGEMSVIFLVEVLGVGPKTLRMLCKFSTSERHPQLYDFSPINFPTILRVMVKY